MRALFPATRSLHSFEASKTRVRVGVVAAIIAVAALATPGAAVAAACGDVLTKSTKLTNDLINCPGDGLVIGAPKVILDLNGHSITGTGNGYGVSNAGGYAKVTIKSGTISGFEQGVVLIGASKNHIRNLTVSQNTGAGILLFASDHTEVKQNSSFSNQEGIFLDAGSIYNVVVENSTNANVLGGVEVGGDSDHNDIVFTTASGNQNGISLNGSFNEVLSNTTSGNSNAGINIGAGGTGNHVAFNNTFANPGGILLFGATSARVEANTVSGNSVGGIIVKGGGSNNTLLRNSVSGSPSAPQNVGIFVGGGSLGSVIDQNTAEANVDDGIHVDEPQTTITENAANNNGDLGIEAVPGVTDGGGNTASGNGNPAQCVGVVCS